MEEKKKAAGFRRFWRANGANLLIGLAITVVICLIVGLRGIFMPLPLWLALGLVCWLVRMGLVYQHWKLSGGEREEPPED